MQVEDFSCQECETMGLFKTRPCADLADLLEAVLNGARIPDAELSACGRWALQAINPCRDQEHNF